MDIAALSNLELTDSLDRLTGNERETIVAILFHLIELEKRTLFRELGYASLFDYCTRRLRYSNASAFRRISAAQCLREHPELKGLLLEGRVTLCSITTASKSIKSERTKIQEIVGKSKREVEAIVAKSDPVSKKPKEVIRPVVVKQAATLFEATKDERIHLGFSIPKETFRYYEEARAKLSNALGKNLDAEAVFSKLLEHYLKPAKARTSSSAGRYLPKSVKQAVYKRDSGRCTFVSDDGIKCTASHYLHYDHILPFAKGGKTELGNLRLICPAHNQLMAQRHFGAEFIQERITSTGGN